MKFNQGVIEFFKKHNMYEEKMFNYLEDNTNMLDYKDPDERCFIGCFYILDKKGKLSRLILNIPYVYDDITALINIHEITHGIEHYPQIGKKFIKDTTIEALPIMYEKLYIMDNPSEELIKYGIYLDTLCNKDNAIEYQVALEMRDELLKNYNYNMKKMKKLTKKIVKKYI